MTFSKPFRPFQACGCVWLLSLFWAGSLAADAPLDPSVAKSDGEPATISSDGARQQASGSDAAGPEAAASDATASDATASETVETEKPPDPCRDPGLGVGPNREMWLDAMQRGIFMSVCSSARWFDGFFGDARFDHAARSTWGRLAINTIWDQKDSLDAKVRFRARVSLPNLDRRFNAFFGRENEEDFVRGRNEGFESLPEFFRDTDDREWLVGLGYNPVGSNADRFDASVGVKLRFPLEPFVQGRYSYIWLLGDNDLVRFRNTVFWRNQHGFGNTISFDFEHAFGPRLLARLANTGTLSEATEGVDWKSSLTLYQALSGPRALSYTTYIDGETDHPVSVDRYGLRVIYRQQMYRQWFFGQLIGGYNRPRDFGEEREDSWELGVGFEVIYGRQPKK